MKIPTVLSLDGAHNRDCKPDELPVIKFIIHDFRQFVKTLKEGLINMTTFTKTMTRAEKIAEIMRIMMKLSGESPEAIKAMQEKCLQSDHSRKADATQTTTMSKERRAAINAEIIGMLEEMGVIPAATTEGGASA